MATTATVDTADNQSFPPSDPDHLDKVAERVEFGRGFALPHLNASRLRALADQLRREEKATSNARPPSARMSTRESALPDEELTRTRAALLQTVNDLAKREAAHRLTLARMASIVGELAEMVAEVPDEPIVFSIARGARKGGLTPAEFSDLVLMLDNDSSEQAVPSEN